MNVVLVKLQAYVKRAKLSKLKKGLKHEGQTITGWVNREIDKFLAKKRK